MKPSVVTPTGRQTAKSTLAGLLPTFHHLGYGLRACNGETRYRGNKAAWILSKTSSAAHCMCQDSPAGA